jgi:hypothetical protein
MNENDPTARLGALGDEVLDVEPKAGPPLESQRARRPGDELGHIATMLQNVRHRAVPAITCRFVDILAQGVPTGSERAKSAGTEWRGFSPNVRLARRLHPRSAS